MLWRVGWNQSGNRVKGRLVLTEYLLPGTWELTCERNRLVDYGGHMPRGTRR